MERVPSHPRFRDAATARRLAIAGIGALALAVVAGGRIRFENGGVRITDKPGLGVDLDYDQVARGEERYRKLTYRKRDDEAEMRKHVDPNWKRILPRW